MRDFEVVSRPFNVNADPTYARPPAPPAPPRLADEQLARIERKLDILIAALADDDEAPEVSLDDGRALSTRDDRRGLG
jgi:hypothetical protein